MCWPGHFWGVWPNFSPRSRWFPRLLMSGHYFCWQEGCVSMWGNNMRIQRVLKTGTDSCKARDLWVTHFVPLQNINKIALSFTSKEIGNTTFCCLCGASEAQLVFRRDDDPGVSYHCWSVELKPSSCCFPLRQYWPGYWFNCSSIKIFNSLAFPAPLQDDFIHILRILSVVNVIIQPWPDRVTNSSIWVLCPPCYSWTKREISPCLEMGPPGRCIDPSAEFKKPSLEFRVWLIKNDTFIYAEYSCV